MAEPYPEPSPGECPAPHHEDAPSGPQVVRTLLAALPTPEREDLAVELFDRLRRSLPASDAPAALLDSSDHARTSRPARSRRSILAFSTGPHALQVRHRAGETGETCETGPQGTVRRTGPFFEWLAEAWKVSEGSGRGSGRASLSEDSPRAVPGADDALTGSSESSSAAEQPFALGWVGWLGYGLKREAGSPDGAATLLSEGAASLPEEDARLFRATHAVVLDHADGTAEVQSLGEDPQWVRRVQNALRSCLEGPGTGPTSTSESPAVTGLRLRDSRAEYLRKIRAAQEQIRHGNSYEVCLTTAVTGRLNGAVDGLALFRRLRTRNRAPFTQYLRFPGGGAEGAVEILSTSPERFLSISAEGLARSEPIKGTRPRSTSPEEDEHLRQDLLNHPKDRAENVMITDLVRNDLSVHAVPGSLRTERLCAVESYPTVHQMVSTVSAQTADGVHPASVVAAAFPPGSMTGAPKISTMGILEELETGARGPYSGVAGYFSTTGAADLSVLIRTAVLTPAVPTQDVLTQDDGDEEGTEEAADGEQRRSGGPALHLGLGGAITADSDPETEWAEVRTKSAGVLSALGETFPER